MLIAGDSFRTVMAKPGIRTLGEGESMTGGRGRAAVAWTTMRETPSGQRCNEVEHGEPGIDSHPLPDRVVGRAGAFLRSGRHRYLRLCALLGRVLARSWRVGAGETAACGARPSVARDLRGTELTGHADRRRRRLEE